MLSLEVLTEADLRRLLPAQTLRYAYGYLGRIQNPVRSGQTLSAQVRGNFLYTVNVEVIPNGLRANCSCGYTVTGYCKHATAVLLKWIREPRSFASGVEMVLGPDEYPIEAVAVEPPPSQRPEQPPAWIGDTLARRQQKDREQLEKWLGAVRLQDLRALARERGWKIQGTRKSEVARQVADQMTDPQGVRRAIASLDAEHRQVLRALVLLAGDRQVEPGDLERVAKMWGPLKSYKQVGTYTRHLWQTGLALPGEVRSSYPAWNDFIPPALARHFPPILEGILPAMSNLPADSLAGSLHLADPLALVRAVAQLVVLLEQTPVPLRPPQPRPRLEIFYPGLKSWDYDPYELARAEKSGRLRQPADLALTVPPPGYPLPDQAMERLAPVAGGEARLDFLYALLVAAGILQPGSPATVWPEVKIEFLRRDEMAQRALLARTYLGMQNWSELWEVLRHNAGLRLKRNLRYAYLKPETLTADLVRFRHLVLRALASLPDGRWVALSDLWPLLQAMWPCFDQSVWADYRYPGMSGTWFLARDDKPLQQNDPADWNLGQGNFIRQVIAGPLHWLGFADLCLAGEELLAFRLHGLADLYWDRVEAPPPPRHAADLPPAAPPTEAVALDELSIRVNPTAVSGQAHSLLDKIARLDTVEANCFVYRLDAQAAYEAFERGAVLSEILDDWARLLPVPMSKPIRAQLTTWWETYGRVRIYQNLTVIEFSDEYALAEMKAVTSLDQYLMAEISPRLVLIRPDAVDTLIAQLERAGYMPKRTEEV